MKNHMMAKMATIIRIIDMPLPCAACAARIMFVIAYLLILNF
jgi:hypothetical protein